MSLNACPAAVIAAPVETVWELLAHPVRFSEWANATVEHFEPESPTTRGQKVYLRSRALGLSWQVVFTVEEVIPDKHTLQFTVELPLGMVLHQRTMCTPIDATSCRVQYG